MKNFVKKKTSIVKRNIKYLLNHVQLYIVINQKLQVLHLESDFLDELHLVDDDYHLHLVDYVLVDYAMVNENYSEKKQYLHHI
jgi:hypothetical protein